MRSNLSKLDRVLFYAASAIISFYWLCAILQGRVFMGSGVVQIVGAILALAYLLAVPTLGFVIAVMRKSRLGTYAVSLCLAIAITGLGMWLRSAGAYDAATYPILPGVTATVLLSNDISQYADEVLATLNIVLWTAGVYVVARIARRIAFGPSRRSNNSMRGTR